MCLSPVFIGAVEYIQYVDNLLRAFPQPQYDLYHILCMYVCMYVYMYITPYNSLHQPVHRHSDGYIITTNESNARVQLY